MTRTPARGYLTTAAAALLLATSVPAADARADETYRIAYRHYRGQILEQHNRQAQAFRSEADPSQSGASAIDAETTLRVLDVRDDGSAYIDERTTYPAEPERIDRRRLLTNRLGGVLWVDVIEGQPSALQGGALLPALPVKVGATWKSRMTGVGGSPGADLTLDVRLAGVEGSGDDAVARLALSGALDAAGVDRMIGEGGIAQGIRGRACRLDGEVLFRVAAGREASSRIILECDLVMHAEDGPPSPARLSLTYETETRDQGVPRHPSP